MSGLGIYYLFITFYSTSPYLTIEKYTSWQSWKTWHQNVPSAGGCSPDGSDALLAFCSSAGKLGRDDGIESRPLSALMTESLLKSQTQKKSTRHRHSGLGLGHKWRPSAISYNLKSNDELLTKESPALEPGLTRLINQGQLKKHEISKLMTRKKVVTFA